MPEVFKRTGRKNRKQKKERLSDGLENGNDKLPVREYPQTIMKYLLRTEGKGTN